MNCTHVERLAPLYAGGDLESDQAEAVRAHAESCARCGRLIAEYQENQGALRSYLPPEFDEATLAELRGAVRGGIAQMRAPSPWLRWLAPHWQWRPAAAAMALLLAGGWALYAHLDRTQSGAKPGSDPAAEPRRSQPTVTPQIVKVDPDADRAEERSTAQPQKLTRAPHRRSRAVERAAPQLPPAPEATPPALIAAEHRAWEAAAIPSPTDTPAEEMLRIEIQTADPNIRIIWLAPKPADVEDGLGAE